MEPGQNNGSKEKLRDPEERHENSFGDLTLPERNDLERFEEEYSFPGDEDELRQCDPYTFFDCMKGYAEQREDTPRADLFEQLMDMSEGGNKSLNMADRHLIALAVGKITDWTRQPFELLAIATHVRTCEVHELREEVKELRGMLEKRRP